MAIQLEDEGFERSLVAGRSDDAPIVVDDDVFLFDLAEMCYDEY